MIQKLGETLFQQLSVHDSSSHNVRGRLRTKESVQNVKGAMHTFILPKCYHENAIAYLVKTRRQSKTTATREFLYHAVYPPVVESLEWAVTISQFEL